VFVAAFGKHPGWDDHIDDIGLETDIIISSRKISQSKNSNMRLCGVLMVT
jgi:hypothetical protein